MSQSNSEAHAVLAGLVRATMFRQPLDLTFPDGSMIAYTMRDGWVVTRCRKECWCELGRSMASQAS